MVELKPIELGKEEDDQINESTAKTCTNGLLMATGVVVIGIVNYLTKISLPCLSTDALALLAVVCGLLGLLYQGMTIHMQNKIKMLEKQQKERERSMKEKQRQEEEQKEEERNLKEKQRLQEEEDATMRRKEKLKNDLKICFEDVRDAMLVCSTNTEKEQSNVNYYLDVDEMRLKLEAIKQDINDALSQFSTLHSEKRTVISESSDVLEQMNVITSFNKEAEAMKEELKLYQKRLEEVKTVYGATSYGRLARKVKSKSVLIKEENSLKLYKLPVKLIDSDPTNKLRLYELGRVNPLKSNKYIMMAGMTGAGKSLLINNIINYVYGVTYRDKFRFQLIVDEEEIKERGPNASRSKAESMTSWVSSFVLHHDEGFRINHSLTIIDTPGFGDTRGIKYDEMIIDQIRMFFDSENVCPVKELSCIGLVIQASQARITEEQKYIFDQVLNIFGKDMTDNIFLLFTFADAQAPPALEVVKNNKIPFNEDATFKFNNSALYAPNNDVASDHSWVFGYDSLERFFDYLSQIVSTSLDLTKEVLSKRDGLKSLLEGLQREIDRGMDMLQCIENMINDILALKGTMRANKDYKIKSKRYPQTTKVINHNITNCKACMFTCHDPCNIPGDDKKSCASMKGGQCVACPGKCPWDSHSNGDRIYVYDEIEVEDTVEDMMDRYQIAMNDKNGKKKLLLSMLDEYRVYRERVFNDIRAASDAAKSLEEIALRQSFLTNVTYIERLIKSEEASSRPNKKVRLEQLHYFIKIAVTLQQARTDPNSLTSRVSGYEDTILGAIDNIKDEIEDGHSYFPSNYASATKSDFSRKRKVNKKPVPESKGGLFGFIRSAVTNNY
ncbi:uncharacterized protein LOC130641735 [Hydractinia symbiolongicarpus]|uniref:uncharacterized protein LOC130641735 n=1 Tax=Hydractinia symbiolongicarpus TaxID=13093 RepID=UPI00254FDD73|nr:uncharacterized protein LOC130641735 [Hydractinia symbiolongicarpus]